VVGQAQTISRLIIRAALAVLAAVLAWKLALLLREFAWAVTFPHGLNYGEGIVWEQMRQMMRGGAYGPIDSFPAIVFHYPPVYYLATAGLAAVTGLDGLAAGRLVSCMATLAAAALIGMASARLVTPTSRARRWIAAGVAGLAFMNCGPVAEWSPYMRVDMLALAFTLGGFALALGAARRPALIHLASVCFVAAVFTKQTMVAAPAAAYLALLITRPRVAIQGVATAVLLGAATLGGLALVTDGGVVRHLFLYNVNRLALWQLRLIPKTLGLHLGFIAVGVTGLCILAWKQRSLLTPAAGGWARLRRTLGEHPQAFALLAALAYLGFTTLMLPLIAKVGADLNYLIEWHAALCLFVGAGAAALLAPSDNPASRLPLKAIGAVLVVGVLVAQALSLPVSGIETQRRRSQASELATFTAMVRDARGDVVSDDMVAVIRGGRTVVWEAAIFAELAAAGLYDERPFVRMIEQQRFGFFATNFSFGHPVFEARYRPAVAAALARHYPVERKLAGLVLHLPAAEAPATR
jgi:hypothetical protein